MADMNWTPFVSIQEYWDHVEESEDPYILAYWEDLELYAVVEYWKNEWCIETGLSSLVTVSKSNPDYWMAIEKPIS